jgi:predicted phosphodiesterase
MAPEPRLRIAHISDLHCGSVHFQPELLEQAIDEINELRPDITIVSGDLTVDGFRAEYELAREYLSRIDCDDMIIVPGNHDSRNVGYVHFEDLFGARSRELHKHGVSIMAVDSSEPDLDHGQIGRNRYRLIDEVFTRPADLRMFVLHHHLIPVPGTGRERNVVYDAGDLLEVLLRSQVNLVLCGHKHVPYAWKLEDLFVVTAGTVSVQQVAPTMTGGYDLQCDDGSTLAVDELVFASSGPATLQILSGVPGTEAQVAALQAMEFHDAHLTVHTDPIYAPSHPLFWSFLNCAVQGEFCEASMWLAPVLAGPPVSTAAKVWKSWTTHRLQQPSQVLHQAAFRHMLPTPATIAAQNALRQTQGRSRIWFAGGYTLPYDAQETALLSALGVALGLAVRSARVAGLQRAQ